MEKMLGMREAGPLSCSTPCGYKVDRGELSLI